MITLGNQALAGRRRCSRCGMAGLLLLLALPIGCGRTSASPSDAQAAARLIQESMDAWKAGATVAQMREKSPPVYVADELWLGGTALSDYELVGQGETFGTNIRFHAVLHCAEGRGKAKKRTVKYLVTTTPVYTISREDR